MVSEMGYRAFRMKEEVILLQHYLEWKMMRQGIKKELTANIVLEYSLGCMEDDRYSTLKFVKSRRKSEIINLKISDELFQNFQLQKERRNLSVSELISICYFIYAHDHLTLEEQNLNYLDRWDIQL